MSFMAKRKQTQKLHTGFDSDEATNWLFLHGKKHLNVLYLMFCFVFNLQKASMMHILLKLFPKVSPHAPTLKIMWFVKGVWHAAVSGDFSYCVKYTYLYSNSFCYIFQWNCYFIPCYLFPCDLHVIFSHILSYLTYVSLWVFSHLCTKKWQQVLVALC